MLALQNFVFVLYVWGAATTNGFAAPQEFYSQERCEKAAQVILAKRKEDGLTTNYVCVEK